MMIKTSFDRVKASVTRSFCVLRRKKCRECRVKMKNVTISLEQRYKLLTKMRTRVRKEKQCSERYKGRGMGMKRKIFAVLLMLVISMTCVACDMGEAVM